MDWDQVKRTVGIYAAQLVPQSGYIGLGSGTTSLAFLQALSERSQKEKLAIVGVPTSHETSVAAQRLGISVVENDWNGVIDVTFDGADAIDGEGTAIKGRGGAFIREKIVALSSRRRVYMVDERKMNKPWKECSIPVAVFPFGLSATSRAIEELGLQGTLRMKGSSLYSTDDGLMVFDVAFSSWSRSLTDLDLALRQIPGVAGTGIFFRIATEIVIGYGDNNVKQVSV